MYKTGSYVTVESDDILAYGFPNQLIHQIVLKELVLAKIFELQYDVMKCQLKKDSAIYTGTFQLKTKKPKLKLRNIFCRKIQLNAYIT